MDACNALIVDDEADIRELIAMTLLPLGVTCLLAETLSEARALLKRQFFSLCITDLRLPDGSGLELVAHIQKHYPNLPVAVITAHGNMEVAVEALKLGAFDFVSKPFELAALREMVATALRLNRGGDGSGANRPTLLGQSSAMAEVRALIAKLARSQAPILISGESGTGKELAARLIHLSGPRADQPFVPVNCGAIPEHLMESEFFGYKKGSFTGATQDKGGLFQAARGGTLFLDEVADLPMPMQVKLLRAIQERAVRPVGAQTEIAIDVRILSASHKDLALLVQNGGFRQDLFYRLNVIQLRLPSLREHPEDIPELANAILERLSRQSGLSRPNLAPSALTTLRAYAFPGNIRELENTLERAFTLCEEGVIQATDLSLPLAMEPTASRSRPPPLAAIKEEMATPLVDQGFESKTLPILQSSSVRNLEDYLEQIERAAILRALEETRYNKTAAAEKLGITFRALRYRLKKLGLD
ncbi:MAG: sigma-54 dependent transcriptional regulator [Candidatus Contendobacter sp.]|nr:sigma-54 dependent transcriptional regulator [Candidatus Contendobacter sp.]MDS4059998.1 sigma-54 dependent transcriptional regulator [Candidatus Contendobacter sp.]